jgi:pimeloyl-ACP methyl ester carboxylesterase
MTVVLVHGLGRSRVSLFLLAYRLARFGYAARLFPYSALTETHDQILSRLVTLLRSQAELGTEVGLVGHSFGGLLLREALAAVPALRVRHFIMLATPNRQPRLALRVYSRFPFRILRGSCGQCLADSEWFRSLPSPAVPYTSIAGTRGWRGCFSPFKGEANDGLVSVSETIIADNQQPFLVPALHTFIMNKACVHRLILGKLGAHAQ